MKKIYKYLISVVIISILAGVAISSPTGPYTGCLSTTSTPSGLFYNFQPGYSPTNACKTGDYQITTYEKTYLDNVLNNLQTQINNLGTGLSSLINRVTNLENNQPYSAIFTMTDPSPKVSQLDSTQGWVEITNLTFYLPKSSYVYVDSTGFAANFKGSVNIIMGIDNNLQDSYTYRSYLFTSGPPNNDCNSCWTGFQTSRGYYLSAGSHTVHLSGSIWNPWSLDYVNIWDITITAIASDKGDAKMASGGPVVSNNKPSIIINKDRSIKQNFGS